MRPNRTQITLTGLIVASLAMNYGWPQVLSGTPPLYALMPLFAGTYLAQFILLAVWGALSAEPITTRIPRSCALLSCCCFSMMLGFQSVDQLPTEVHLGFMLVGLALFLNLFLLFVVIRRLTKRVIRKPATLASRPAQFGILSILIWTAVVAIFIAASQNVFEFNGRVRMPSMDVILKTFGIVMILGVFVGSIGLPMTWVVLSEETDVGCFALLAGVFLIGVPAVTVLLGLAARRPYNTLSLGYFMMFAMGVGAMTLTGLWTARCLGFRLERE